MKSIKVYVALYTSNPLLGGIECSYHGYKRIFTELIFAGRAPANKRTVTFNSFNGKSNILVDYIGFFDKEKNGIFKNARLLSAEKINNPIILMPAYKVVFLSGAIRAKNFNQ